MTFFMVVLPAQYSDSLIPAVDRSMF